MLESNLLKPNVVIKMELMVVTPPFGTDPRNELIPANQKHGSIKHSRTCFHRKDLAAVVS